MFRTQLLPLLLSSFAIALPSVNGDEITVTNLRDKDIVRHSVVLVRGTYPDGAKLTVENEPAAAEPRPVVHDGHFKVLVPLSEGANSIQIKAGDDSKTLNVTFKPQTNPHYVRLIWLTDNSGDTTFASPSKDVPQDYESRLRTAGLLMQCFTADRMNQLGCGQRTFRLERDERGEVVVHTLKAPEPAEFYYDLGDSGRYWNAVRVWLNKAHPDPYAKNIVLVAFTRKDLETGKMKGHTALGGGNLGLFGSASVFSWPRDLSGAIDVFNDKRRVDPTRVHEDSAGRGTYWGVASTTIGATLHEMGHTFDLLHCSVGTAIMSRGFDHFNRAFTFADPPSGRNRNVRYFESTGEAKFARISGSSLRWSRWFQADFKPEEKRIPLRIDFNRESQEITLKSEAGVAWIGFFKQHDMLAFHEMDASKPPNVVVLTAAETKEIVDGKAPSHIMGIAGNGEVARLRIRLK